MTTWGFRDSVNVDTGSSPDFYLSLDQGMIMAALGNALGDDMLRDAFATKEVEGGAQADHRHRGVRGQAGERRASRRTSDPEPPMTAASARIAWFDDDRRASRAGSAGPGRLAAAARGRPRRRAGRAR